MSSFPPQEITQLLRAWSSGNSEAFEKLAVLVEADLRRIAKIFMNKERKEHTLQPTAVMSETYLRLMQWKNANWENRQHFMRVAATIMRRILVDYARRRRPFKPATDRSSTPVVSEREIDFIALDQALKRLAELDPRQGEIVELRFFGGYSVEETAAIIKSSRTTVNREWKIARAWLRSELGADEKDEQAMDA